MDQFPILKSLIRVALAQDDGPVRHQVERLAASLHKAGDVDAAALDRLLASNARSKTLTPSRLTQSSAVLQGQASMSKSVAVPVDRETAAPLATVIFPEHNDAELPVFPGPIAEVIDALLREWEHQDRLVEAGLSPSLSALIYGLPGTGKTTLALWFARRLKLPAVVARLDGLISSYLGSTARNIGALFTFADRYDCVLVLDEFDAIAKLRNDPNEVGEIKRVVNALLQNIDLRAGKGITIGLTNHEALLDPAVWRRFEVQLAVPLPGPEQRVAIARSALSPQAPSADAEAKLLAWAAESLSGAELRTMAGKFRKRRVLDAESKQAPAQVVGQLTMTTSSRTTQHRARELLTDGTPLTRTLSESEEIRFSQTDLAHLLGVSTKTIGRRVSDLVQEQVDDAE